ncbi:Pr6Pr family membrane protein [Arthrobacter sp. A2-55]|uniref:Pr6Pr family membrane protein n=1 Tax=Arthrobacter sp. A2-55 TaxID=2897337 RepID=UPI0021CDB557|nr:Pr6Pr family membrane protein [Arthrobacter sp. A2-55]MCU6479610.1 Pr6Pr family membrane protein [Arthrobacter sp. A2-55]
MTLRRVLAALRFLLGAVTLAAVGIQLGIHISHGFNVLNFFSYFTNLSNIFAACVLLVESVLAWRGRELGPLWQLARCASVVCMALVGIVFSALLRDVDLGSLLPWINTWLHYVMPVAVVLDWLVQSPRLPIAFRRLGLVLVLPVAYLAYSLVRGAAINWYAYPFLNPANGGYGTVALTCVLIAVAFLAVSAVLVVAGNKLRPLIAPNAVSGSVPAGR